MGMWDGNAMHFFGGEDLYAPHPACRFVRIAAVCLLLVGAAVTRAAAQTPDVPPHDQVYLLRGAFNVFSLGLDSLGDSLQKAGISNTVTGFTSWSSLADEAAADYKSGRVRRIVIVGHSSGATAVTYMVGRLGELGVPVTLAIGLDPSSRVAVSGHVARYVNYYIPGMFGSIVDRSPGFDGTLENVNMESDPSGVGHFSFEKNPAMQELLLKEIEAALKEDAQPASPRPQKKRQRSAAARRPVASAQISTRLLPQK